MSLTPTATPLRPPRAGLDHWEWAGLAVLVAVAAALRFWRLWEIPSPTDEILGTHIALQIARGEILPLTDQEPYIGSLWTYLLALGYLLFGPNANVPRAVTLLAGVLTVPAAYLLGRELGGRLAGWIAAILTATSAAHILAASHPAWSHCLSPLFGTLGLWQLHRGLRLQDGRDLLASGFWLGLALQSHLTMLAFLPGVAAYFWLKGRHWLKTPWPYLAAFLGIVMISNLLVFNLQTGFATLRRTEVVRDSYARAKGSGPELYLSNLQRLGVGSLRALSGAVDIRESPTSYLRDPLVLAPALLALAGAALLLLRGDPLPLLVTIPYLGLLVVFNAKYEVIPNSRFLTPLAPLIFSCIGVLGAASWEELRQRNARWAAVGLALAIGLLAGFSIHGLARRYEQMASSATTTAGLMAAVDFVESARRPEEAVLLDRNLDKLWLDGGGDLWMALRFEFARRGAPLGDLPGRMVPATGDTNPCDRQALVAARIDLSRETPSWLREAIEPAPSALPTKFWTFRVVPRLTRPESLGPNEQLVFQYQPPISGSTRTVDRCLPGRQI